jgi:hypothetical protein
MAMFCKADPEQEIGYVSQSSHNRKIGYVSQTVELEETKHRDPKLAMFRRTPPQAPHQRPHNTVVI